MKLPSGRNGGCLDMETGIRQVGGDPDLYLELLRRFALEYGGRGEEVGRQLAMGDRVSAAISAHSLMEVAGVLAAGPLHAAARELETALRDGSGPVESLLARLRHELAAVMGALDRDIPR